MRIEQELILESEHLNSELHPFNYLSLIEFISEKAIIVSSPTILQECYEDQVRQGTYKLSRNQVFCKGNSRSISFLKYSGSLCFIKR